MEKDGRLRGMHGFSAVRAIISNEHFQLASRRESCVEFYKTSAAKRQNYENSESVSNTKRKVFLLTLTDLISLGYLKP